MKQGFVAEIEQCMYGLVSESGRAHRKPTRFLASHEELLVDLDKTCDGSHEHELVLGGPSVTARTGHYTTELAQSIVKGLLKLCLLYTSPSPRDS